MLILVKLLNQTKLSSWVLYILTNNTKSGFIYFTKILWILGTYIYLKRWISQLQIRYFYKFRKHPTEDLKYIPTWQELIIIFNNYHLYKLVFQNTSWIRIKFYKCINSISKSFEYSLIENGPISNYKVFYVNVLKWWNLLIGWS